MEGESMIKTATKTAANKSYAGVKSANPATHDERSNATCPSTGRFPPIETALMSIINNKRLEGAKKIV